MTVTANFTAEPVAEFLRFWFPRLGLGSPRVLFSGYNQVFQDLMAPDSLLASSTRGVNCLLIRLEDWGRDQDRGHRAEVVARSGRELVDALSAFAKRARRQTLLFLCPPSSRVLEDLELESVLGSVDSEIRRAISALKGISVITPGDMARLYPVKVVDDPESHREGHIPFTRPYWAAIGTMLARKMSALLRAPYKVIVVDADNTLWGGVVGEVGADRIRVSDEWHELQRFLRERKTSGMLLALVSKNREEDVAEVFRRADMVLRREDFVAWKANWDPKSRNIAVLAAELDLGLDSFLFLDDNPVECAEVAAHCPDVTTLLLPSDSREIPEFVRHVWAFDVAVVTASDEKRTELYRQQSERNQFRTAVAGFREFIAGLQLDVSLAAPAPADYARAAQLTQRTNQFNASGIRRTASELGSLLESGERSALLVRARDRFGDYGEAGLAVWFHDGAALVLETFLMSCRVLGKGVEHRALAALGLEAQRLGASDVAIPFTATLRNQPVDGFLKSIGARLLEDGAYHLTAAEAAAVVFDPEHATYQTTAADERPDAPAEDRPSRPDFATIASELSSPDAIVRAVARDLQRARPNLANDFVPPRTSAEARLATIWEQVLHVTPVGVTDPFLGLGGQSLQAASIVARIAEECGVRVPLSAMLSNPTVAELNMQLDDLPRTNGEASLPKAREWSLSPAQRRLWFLDQFIPNRAAYNIPLGWRVRGTFDVYAFEVALSRVLERHELLRSTYSADDESTALKVATGARVAVEQASADSEAQALTLANDEARRPFDLSAGPVLRCLAVTINTTDHLIVLNVHHIVSDGWSMEVLARDIADAYAAGVAGREPSWQPLAASYADYALWQRDQIRDGSFQADLQYWTKELRGAPSLLDLPSDMRRPSVMTYSGSSVFAQVSAGARLALETLAQRENCTPFTVLLAAWQAVLYRYTQQDDLVVGVPVAGRSHPSVEDLVGCFVNTLPIRTPVNGDASFLEHVQAVRGRVVDALSHQELPFEHLVTELKLGRDLSRSPLFQVMLVLQSRDADLPLADLDVTPVRLHNGGAKFDLVLEVIPTGNGYNVALEFSTSLFLPETAERMLGHFVHVVEHACVSPDTSIASLPMMDAAEVRRTLAFVNDNTAVWDDVECLHRSFELRASLSPEAPALSFEGQIVSYGELNQRANKIAHYLIANGIGPDVLVGICLDRTPDLVSAILAILKAGGAYLPIDLSYPPDRLAFMLSDAGAPLLLTERKLLGSLPPHDGHTICLGDAEAIRSVQPSTNPVTGVTPEHMAYVIYTSGSTGKPKGCMVTHRNVARLMRATEGWYVFDDRDVWTLFHSVAFDFSVWEIWGALLYGGRIVVVPFLVSRSPEAFYELLVQEQVTVLNQTPSAFRQLIQAEEAVGARTLALRYVIFGGEALEMQSLQPWFDRHGDQKPLLVNMYGITETTVHVTYRPLSTNDVRSASVIGVPIPDLQIYILDPRRQPVPVGVPGEMYVGGAGLARGYLHRPELTAERFVADTLSGQPGGRLYRTGDLARFLPGRDIEYLGRIDHQVKIRGFRIELGEIESVLCQHPAVREAVVMAREDVPGSKRLVAYAVTSQPAPEVTTLREYLKVKLPEYMVPAAFVFLDKLPLTSSGKIDRKTLPVPEQQRPELAGRYVAPRTATERTLAAIWSKVLRVEQVGVHDNFFELGGDSILSIQIISLARRQGLTLTPKLLFANQAIADLAAVAGTAVKIAAVAEGTLAGDVPLTPIQRWFFEQNLQEPHRYNQAFLFEVSEPMEQRLLERALTVLGRHHDGLRLRYVVENAEWRQFYDDADAATPLRWVDLWRLTEDEQRKSVETIATSTQGDLHLGAGPLWRAVYFDLGPNRRGRLLLVVHHLAVDGISWRFLIEDLETAYRQIKAGEAAQLPPKTTSFKAWAERLHKYAEAQTLCDQLPYWKSVGETQGATTGLTLAAGADALATNTERSSQTMKVALTTSETQSLLQDVPAAYNTQINDVLLTALAQAWNQATGSPAIFTNLEGHGRENLFDDVDLSRTVGWFTSIFPVCLTLPKSNGRWGPGDALKAIKEQLRQVPQRGIGYGVLRYLTRAPDVSQMAEPSMVFNYLGQFDQVLSGSRLFGFASESTGPWHSPSHVRRHALEVNGLVIGGRLEIGWTYSENMHVGSTILRLAEEFIGALKELIAHCVSPDAGGRTASDFPLARLDQAAIDHLVAGRRDVEDIYPLSPIQTLFYSANPGAILSLFDQWQCTLGGDVNVAAFQLAWQETLGRHTILRSTIHGDGLPEPLQVVHRNVDPSWTVEDWRQTPAAEQEERWDAFLRSDRATPLNLTEAPVMRFALLRLADDRWKFLWSVPALLLDGWSWPLVFHDVSALYAAFSGDAAAELDPVRPYREYLSWLGQQSTGAAQEFWRTELAGFLEPTPLPGDAPDPSADKHYVKHTAVLSSETTTALNATARGQRLTMSSLVQGAWAVVLSRESGAADVAFGAAFAGRPTDLSGAESIVGPFVNNVPVRTMVKPETTVAEFFGALHAHVLAISPHQFTPLMEIQRGSEVPWRQRLFESVVVFQNYLVDESARRIGEIEIADFEGPIHTNYPLMLLAEPGPALRLTFIYDQQLMARSAVERSARSMALILQALPDLLDKPLGELHARLPPPVVPTRGSRPRQRLRAASQNYLPPQTDMEHAIAGVWQRMFGLEKVGIDENFFDLGSYSLLLVQMHGQLREVLKADFSIVTLFEHPTVRSLAQHLGEPAVSTMDTGAQWRDRAQRQKQALSQLKTKLKREGK